jgi:hypothetical protein
MTRPGACASPLASTRRTRPTRVRTAHGWYDVTVTIDIDASWSQRFTGHLENGQPGITG